jgi:hypothetical protein
MVNGKQLPAMIFERENKSYRVRFNNGFEDVFTLVGEDDNLDPIGTKPGWQTYSPGLLNELRILRDLDDGQFVKVFTHVINEKIINVWIVKQDGEQPGDAYYIYFDGRCQFKMMKPGKTLEITHYDSDEEINLRIAEMVVKLLSVPA